MNKKFLILTSLFSLATLSSVLLSPLQAHAAITGPVVYFVPHQDDEVISMGASIEAEVGNGRTVYIVQVTDGGGSSAIKVVNQRLKKEGRKELTKAEFSKARTLEQKAALTALGVKPENIFYEDFPDSGITDNSRFTAIIEKYVDKYPTASFKTMSFIDALGDHARLAWALNDKCTHNADRITDCRFLQSPIYQKNSSISYRNGQGVTVAKINTPKSYFLKGTPGKLGKAIDEYYVWNPAKGRYAVGSTSVKVQLDYVKGTLLSKVHFSDHYWENNADMQAGEKWLKDFQSPSFLIRSSHHGMDTVKLQNPSPNKTKQNTTKNSNSSSSNSSSSSSSSSKK